MTAEVATPEVGATGTLRFGEPLLTGHVGMDTVLAILIGHHLGQIDQQVKLKLGLTRFHGQFEARICQPFRGKATVLLVQHPFCNFPEQ